MPELYDYQEDAVQSLMQPDKHIVVADMGLGKTAMSLRWALTTPNRKWLVVTTASARDSGQWYNELHLWTPEVRDCEVEVISWQGLAKWTVAHWADIPHYTFIFDEVRKAAAGVSSQRGRAFLQITKTTPYWAGFTGTPGDRWIDFQAYFVAGGYVKNKSQFQRDFCKIQTYKGYPEIVGYHSENLLKRWWNEMSVQVDGSEAQREIPTEQHFVHRFKMSSKYKNILKTREYYGRFLDTPGALCSALRQECFTKGKQQWLTDYLETLGTNTVLFYHFTATGEKIYELARKALPKNAKIWQVNGAIHEIPTKETIGKYDIVICQWEAGSEALNLQFMHEWVAVEPTYRYSTAVQARGRIKRIGQQRAMSFHYLKCPSTIEDSIYEALHNKGEFAESVWYEQLKQQTN